jgi:hypothetical protein
MRTLSESKAISALGELRARFRMKIAEAYERRAKACDTCETRGACCLDAHFVNVRISRLEARAIVRELDGLDGGLRAEVYRRISDAVERFGLNSGEAKTYACPLFDSEAGCLVHDTAKPLPCIHHACYEQKDDLPPDELLDRAELAVDRLNRRVYARHQPPVSLPLAIANVRS